MRRTNTHAQFSPSSAGGPSTPQAMHSHSQRGQCNQDKAHLCPPCGSSTQTSLCRARSRRTSAFLFVAFRATPRERSSSLQPPSVALQPPSVALPPPPPSVALRPTAVSHLRPEFPTEWWPGSSNKMMEGPKHNPVDRPSPDERRAPSTRHAVLVAHTHAVTFGASGPPSGKSGRRRRKTPFWCVSFFFFFFLRILVPRARTHGTWQGLDCWLRVPSVPKPT